MLSIVQKNHVPPKETTKRGSVITGSIRDSQADNRERPKNKGEGPKKMSYPKEAMGHSCNSVKTRKRNRGMVYKYKIITL